MNTVCQRIMDQLQEAYYMNNLETSVEEKKKRERTEKKYLKKIMNGWVFPNSMKTINRSKKLNES